MQLWCWVSAGSKPSFSNPYAPPREGLSLRCDDGMGLLNRYWLYVAAISFSSLVGAAANVSYTGDALRLNGKSIATPANSSILPGAPLPPINIFVTPDEELRYPTAYSVVTDILGLPPITSEAEADVIFERDDLVDALLNAAPASSPAESRARIDAIMRIAEARGWELVDGQFVIPADGDGGGGYSGWSPTSYASVQHQLANNPLLRSNSGWVRPDIARVPMDRDDEGEPIIPMRPGYMPSPSSAVMPCPAISGIPSNNQGCTVVGAGERPYGGNQYEFRSYYAPVSIPVTFDGQSRLSSPKLVGTVNGVDNVLSNNDIIVAYTPDDEFVDSDHVVTPSEYIAAVEQDYRPQPEDWHDIFKHLPPSAPSRIEAKPIGSVDTPAIITTETDDETGDVKTIEESFSVSYGFERNNVPQPAIAVDLQKAIQEWLNGLPVGGGTTDVHYPPIIDGGGGGGGGGDGGSSVGPTGPGSGDVCTWFDLFCEFYDWIKGSPDDIPEAPDLDQLRLDETDFQRTFTFSSGSMSCPEPVTIHISFVGTDVQITYDWWCQLAVTIYPFVMLSAYVLAIYITLGMRRN